MPQRWNPKSPARRRQEPVAVRPDTQPLAPSCGPIPSPVSHRREAEKSPCKCIEAYPVTLDSTFVCSRQLYATKSRRRCFFRAYTHQHRALMQQNGKARSISPDETRPPSNAPLNHVPRSPTRTNCLKKNHFPRCVRWGTGLGGRASCLPLAPARPSRRDGMLPTLPCDTGRFRGARRPYAPQGVRFLWWARLAGGRLARHRAARRVKCCCRLQSQFTSVRVAR